MSVSDQELLHHLGLMPFIDAGELALILGEPLATVHRALSALLKGGLAGRVSHGTAHLPSSHRYYLTKQGIAEAADVLGYDAPSDFVRAYPGSRQWLTLLIRRMDAVALVYRLAATLSPSVDGLETQVEFQRRGRFDAVITLHNGRSFGVVRQGLALRRRSLYDRLRAIAEYHHNRRPAMVLVLVPSPWEQRLTDEFCLNVELRDCYVAVENRETLEGWERLGWISSNWVVGRRYRTLEQVVSEADAGMWFHPEAPERKRASLPDPERMVRSAPAFRVSPAEKRALDLVTHHPMIPPGTPGPLAGGVGRESQPDDPQPDTDLAPGGASWQTERRALRPVRPGHQVHHPPGPGATVHHHGNVEHGGRHRQSRTAPSPGT
ncbi:MAG: hypothetical protein F4X27_16730, partial [Chloroflexi bacterium]|nr:hypothetical protein [Chloroflexota bacterium]